MSPLRRPASERVRELIDACRVPDRIEPREFGPWMIRRVNLGDIVLPDDDGPSALRLRARMRPYRSVTILRRFSAAAAPDMTDGEIVMEDSPGELRKHLPILLAAYGRVLVSGLGLGCVVRGLLKVRAVRRIDVVEIDRSILEAVGPSLPQDTPRLRLHLGDALTFRWPAGTRFDFAWHDVWTDREHLDVLHARLLLRYRGMAAVQGAWGMNRESKTLLGSRMPLIGGSRRRCLHG